MDVGAVAGLGDRATGGQLARADLAQVALVVWARPDLLDRPTEQPELDPELDEQGQVAEPQALERRHVRARIVATAELRWEPRCGQPLADERLGPLQHPLAVLVGRHRDRRLELRTRQNLARLLAQRRIATVEHPLERSWVKARSCRGVAAHRARSYASRRSRGRRPLLR